MKDAEGADAVLFTFIDGLPEADRYSVKIPSAPGRKARTAELALRFSSVKLCKPLHGAAPDLPESVTLTLVDVREVSPLEDGEPRRGRLRAPQNRESSGEGRQRLCRADGTEK